MPTRTTSQCSLGERDSTVPTPSTWPCTTCPPRRPPALTARSRLTGSPPARPPRPPARSVSAPPPGAPAARPPAGGARGPPPGGGRARGVARGAAGQAAEAAAAQRLGHHVGGPDGRLAVGLDAGDGQTDAVDRDGVAEGHVLQDATGADAQHGGVGRVLPCGEGAAPPAGPGWGRGGPRPPGRGGRGCAARRRRTSPRVRRGCRPPRRSL